METFRNLWNQPENPGNNGGKLQENEKNMQKQKNTIPDGRRTW